MANSERIYLIQGNDTDMSVCLRKGGDTPLPYDLTGASRIGLALTGHGLSFFARDIEVSGEDNNIISGLLAGDLLVGEYGLEVSFTLDGKAKRFRVPQVFEVVTYLSEDQDGTAEGEGDGISITVTVQPEVIEIAGPTGPQGHDGKSAYEVWLDEGHTGDEDDFFRWLAAQTPNPDWAQNDASEPDYVENRTHYDIPAVSLPDTFITFRWTEDDYSDLMFYLNDETPMPRMSENTWGVQLGQWLLSCYINGNVLEVDLDGDPILTVANFRPGRTPQPISVGDIEVPELVQQLDGKYLALKTVNGQSVKGSGDIALNGGNLEYTGDDGEYISGGDSINSSLLLLDEAVDETNGRLDNLKGSQVVYDGEDGDSVIVHGETVDQCLKGLDDQAAYIIENYQYKIPDIDTIRAGAALGATAYQKPSTGIPKSALASAVKTSLEKADTALQPSDLNGYATEDYVDEEVSGKQDTLISGENIKTINGQSVLGSGDIQTGGGSADAVKYTEQELTDSQKEQARTNIGAASESEVSQLRSEMDGKVHSKVDIGINKFNKNSDNLFNGYCGTNNYVSNNSYRMTHPIWVEAGKTYKWPAIGALGTSQKAAYCTSDGKFISSFNVTTDSGFCTATMANDGYVRVNIGTVNQLDAFMFCIENEYPDSYVPYTEIVCIGNEYHLGDNQIQDVENIVAPIAEKADAADAIVELFSKIDGVNLFDKTDPRIKNGYYNTSGNFQSNQAYYVTGPIPVIAGVTYKAKHYTSIGSTNNIIAIVDSNNDKTGIMSGVIADGFITFTPTENCLVSMNGGSVNGLDTFMICVSSDYPDSYVQYIAPYTILNEESTPNPLTGKSVIFAGDSICAAPNDVENGGGWAKRIGVKNHMYWSNKAVSGATIIDHNLVGSGFTISDTDFGGGADYIILEGGTNDADRIGSILGDTPPALFGTFDETDYVTSFDDQTFCSAVQRLIQRTVSAFPSARVGFIIAPKMGVTSNGYTKETNNRRAYFETIIEICHKWGVPVLNLWDECTMNPKIASHYDSSTHGPLYYDGQHPAEDGYKLITPIVEAWMKTL